MDISLKTLIAHCVAQEHRWKFQLLTSWKEILGDLSAHVSIEKIEHETITLQVNDSCWMQELYMLSSLLLEKINQSIDQPRIKRIFFKQACTPRKRKSVKKTPRCASKIVSRPLLSYEREALQGIRDTALQEMLTLFLFRCEGEQ